VRLDTFTVLLPDSARWVHAPIPNNDSERLLFPLFFETLVRLDCQNQVRPELAVAWSVDKARRTWTFRLRDGHDSDGSPAAPKVISSWQAHKAVMQALGIDSVKAIDGQLTVILREPGDSVPRLFADPALAVPHDSAARPTAWLRITRSDGPQPAVVEFRVEQGSDPRDALDRGADLLVTRDPALVNYAESRPEFATYPLPWSRTYLLLQPRGAEPLEAGIARDSVRRSLARDVVRAEARAAEPPFWWDSVAGCRAILSNGLRASSSRVVYPRGDEAARGLAERVVALAAGGSPLRAAGLREPELAAALRDGTERAYVVPVPRQSLAPCRDSATWPPGASIQPLIDTRARAILRRGSAALTVDWDGTVRLADVDPAAEAP
jgi:hypothetical protein